MSSRRKRENEWYKTSFGEFRVCIYTYMYIYTYTTYRRNKHQSMGMYYVGPRVIFIKK